MGEEYTWDMTERDKLQRIVDKVLLVDWELVIVALYHAPSVMDRQLREIHKECHRYIKDNVDKYHDQLFSGGN